MGLGKRKPASSGILDSRKLDAAIGVLQSEIAFRKKTFQLDTWGSDGYGNKYWYSTPAGGAVSSPSPVIPPVWGLPVVSAALDEFSPDAAIPWRCTLCGERSPEAVIVMGTKPDTFWTEWACKPCCEKAQRWKLPCMAAIRGAGRDVTIDGMVSSGPLPDWCGMEDCREPAAVIVAVGGTCGTEFRRPMCHDDARASVQSPPQADYCPEPHLAKYVRVVSAGEGSPVSFKWL